MQKTIKNSVSVSGVGIHTGVTTNMTLKPAEANTGIRFVRTDLSDKIVIKADVDNVFSTERSTGLKNVKAEINTVEHILAAVVGSEIDNLIIEVDNIEIPILDGSSKKFTELIEQTGTTKLNVTKNFFEIKRKISFTDKENGTILTATPSDEYAVKVEIDYNSEILGIQKAEINSIKEFNSEITSSRTFCFLHELEVLLANNLIKGGDVNNAIVIVEEEISEEKLNKLARAFNKSDIKVGEGGVLNNLKLRHKNEPARHKLLDIIGDLSLVGKPIKGNITAYKPGHKSNTKFAKQLKKIMEEDMRKIVPKINFDEAPLYDRAKIKTILPHRKPFLFIDEIRELGKDYIIGIKFVT